MRTVIQRVKSAQVSIDGKQFSRIGEGLLVLLAVGNDDSEAMTAKMADKILNLRIFGDQNNKMNNSLIDKQGEIMVVSQFTLYGDCSQGNRPSFIQSADPEKAIKIYEKFIEYLISQEIPVKTGKFGKMMEVELINDGPVTIILEL